MEAPRLEKGNTVPQMQRYINDMVKHRGFTEDILKLYVLFSEECGELAKEIRNVWEKKEKLIKEGLSEEEATQKALGKLKPKIEGEVADCFMYLLDMSNRLGVDVEKAVIEKEAYNATRTWE